MSFGNDTRNKPLEKAQTAVNNLFNACDAHIRYAEQTIPGYKKSLEYLERDEPLQQIVLKFMEELQYAENWLN